MMQVYSKRQSNSDVIFQIRFLNSLVVDLQVCLHFLQPSLALFCDDFIV